VKNSFFQFPLLRWLLPALLALLLSACTGMGPNRLVAEGKIATSISAVSHYGKGIGIGDFYINGKWGGVLYDGWGGGGGGDGVLRDHAECDQRAHHGYSEMEDLSYGSRRRALA
jgi:hypothetical protein